MKTHVKVPISPEIARAYLRTQGVHCSLDRLPDSFRAVHDQRESLIHGPAENLPKTLAATKGQRRRGALIPPNVAANFQASEDQAWAHSIIAGVLWENGLRASRAISLAETQLNAEL